MTEIIMELNKLKSERAMYEAVLQKAKAEQPELAAGIEYALELLDRIREEYET